MRVKTFAGFAKTREGKPVVRIITVLACTSEEAQHEIERQLRKAGRKAYLDRWINDGRHIGEVSK